MNSKLKRLLRSIGAELTGRLKRHIRLEPYLERLDQLLLTAGEPGDLKGVELFGAQVLSGALFPLVWGVLLNQIGLCAFLFEGPKQILSYLALLLVGFLFPKWNVTERARKRQHSVAMQLPDTLDLLTISVEAGLDFLSAMRRVVEKHRPGPLADELQRFFKRTELNTPRREALREFAARIQLQDLSAIVSAMIQADQLGVSIGPILRTQSDMLRTRRAQRAEKAAHEAPVKMLAPLVLCILPAVFIMILAPVCIQMIIDATH